MADYVTVEGTHGHEIRMTLKDAAGQEVNLTGATAKLHIKRISDVEGAGAELSAEVVGTGPDVRRVWEPDDLVSSGRFEFHAHVTFADLSTQVFPSGQYLSMIVRPALVAPGGEE